MSLGDRVATLEDRADNIEAALIRGSEQFSGVNRRIDDTKDDLHRAIKSSREEARADTAELNGRVSGLKDGQVKILQALEPNSEPSQPSPVPPVRIDKVNQISPGWMMALPLLVRILIAIGLLLGAAVGGVWLAIVGTG